MLLLTGALLSCQRGPKVPQPPPGTPRHAILIVLDTFRADIAAEVSTPVLDGLAAAGSTPKRAWSPGTWTVPSVMSMMTGAPLRTLGWDYAMPTRGDPMPPIPETFPTLAERLKALGFQTAGLYSNPILKPELGFDRGFDHWEHVRDRKIAASAEALVRRWDDDERHFLYVHYSATHQPLTPSKEARARWSVPDDERFELSQVKESVSGQEAYSLAYRAEAEDVDRRLGRLLRTLGSHAEDAVIVVTSDHGELLGEHGRAGHGRWVWEPLTHVPFVAVNGPELPDLLSAAAAADVLTRGLGLDMAWPVTIEDGPPLVSQREGSLALTVDGVQKGIWTAPDSRLAQYDLSADPGEIAPLQVGPEVMEGHRAAWEAGVVEGVPAHGGAPMSADLEEALREIGYIE